MVIRIQDNTMRTLDNEICIEASQISKSADNA